MFRFSQHDNNEASSREALNGYRFKTLGYLQ
jgi:hypothetical protein